MNSPIPRPVGDLVPRGDGQAAESRPIDATLALARAVEQEAEARRAEAAASVRRSEIEAEVELARITSQREVQLAQITSSNDVATKTTESIERDNSRSMKANIVAVAGFFLFVLVLVLGLAYMGQGALLIDLVKIVGGVIVGWIGGVGATKAKAASQQPQ